MRVTLNKPGTGGAAAQGGEKLKDVGVFTSVGRDLIDSPFKFNVDFSGVDGRTVVRAELIYGGVVPRSHNRNRVAGLSLRRYACEFRQQNHHNKQQSCGSNHLCLQTWNLLEDLGSFEIAGLHDRHAVGIDVPAERRIDLVGGERLDLRLEIGRASCRERV